MLPKYYEDDTPIVEACINGDTAAWAALVKKYSGLILLSIQNRLKKCGFDPLHEETEDIRQNILASIWRGGKLINVKNRKNIAHWISIVSGNGAIEHMRKKLAGKNPKFVPFSNTLEAEKIAAGPERADKTELSEMIESSIDSLPPKERLVMKLNLLYGKGYYEIAEILNMPKGTVSSYIKRAKEKLRKRLKDF
jgi:RNA polymerase sigma-70 factor (ECF subfamily)